MRRAIQQARTVWHVHHAAQKDLHVLARQYKHDDAEDADE
jgi:hypothetical protein